MQHTQKIAERYLGSVFGGGSLNEGLDHARNISGISQTGIRELVLNALIFVLNFLSLAAVVVIVIAGFYLVLGGGSEESKEKAKKMVLYVVIGLIVIFLARVIVGFFLTLAGVATPSP
ncbi:MAG: pilin [Patescibacteria group bacterium]